MITIEVYRGNRLRQYYKIKGLFNEEEWEEILDDLKYNKETRKCPVCRNNLYHNSWSEYLDKVEEIYTCSSEQCNYTEHEYYGVTEWKIGDFENRFHGHEISYKEYFSYRREFDAAIEKARIKYKNNIHRNNIKYKKRKLS